VGRRAQISLSVNRTHVSGQVLVMPMNDSEIIRRSRDTPDAFGEIFDRHFDAIAAFSVRRLGVDRGEDVAGDVFRLAFEHRERFNPIHESARPWLFGIANNLVRRARRTVGRQNVAYDRWLLREVIVGVDMATRVTVDVDAQRDLANVLDVLRRQPVEEVEALLMFAWEQLTYTEIAVALSIPVGTVRSRIHRLRQTLDASIDTPVSSFDTSHATQGGGI
jgi:RNA polymerase sigma factor (sigma-70 family)